jgi:glycerophosphoryl diester phosphodiesterase
LVIGHRGAPGHLPEHSARSYRLACTLGADALETDLVMTRDGILVVRHENELSRTTDVAGRPEFACRRTTKVVGGALTHGWFTEDFTLAELRTLGAPGPEDRVMTFDELLLLVAEESRRRGRRIGLHVEVKTPTYFASLGLPMAGKVLSTLRDHGLERPGSRVWLQSFDDTFVRLLDPLTSLPLVQLVAPEHLRERRVDCAAVAAYADAIGPERGMVLRDDVVPTGLVEEAHAAGLRVFVWTLRGEAEQAESFFRAGVDGVFSDHPDRALVAREGLAVPRAVAQTV